MSRDEGFAIADVDVGLLDDVKIRRLARRLRDGALIAQCVVAYEATFLASWADGERVAIEQAAPLWLDGIAALRTELETEALLDDSGRIPEHVWIGWFDVAKARRETARGKWRRANDRRAAKARLAIAAQGDDPMPHHGGNPRGDIEVTPTSVPPVPSAPPVPIRQDPSLSRPHAQGRLESVGTVLGRLRPEPGGSATS